MLCIRRMVVSGCSENVVEASSVNVICFMAPLGGVVKFRAAKSALVDAVSPDHSSQKPPRSPGETKKENYFFQFTECKVLSEFHRNTVSLDFCGELHLEAT